MRSNDFERAYYFSYGHLTLTKETQHLSPKAEFIGVGYIKDFRLVMRNFCDIENHEGSRVYGAIWEIPRSDFKKLDKHESIHKDYDRVQLQAHIDNQVIDVMVYIMDPDFRIDEPPSQKYVNQVKRGYQEHGIPIGQLEQALDAKQDLAEEILDEFTAYHGTYRPTLVRFKPLSHFGTERAAAERLQHVKDTNPALADKPGYIYQLDLGITNPGRVKDYVNLTDPGPGSMKKIAAWSKDLLKNPSIVSYTGKSPINGKTDTGVNILKHFITLANSGYWADYYPYTKFIAMWINFLLSAGIDGLVYNNQIEHNRSTSFITFNPDQIKVVGKPKVVGL